jgi:hypothetical protein
LIGFPAFCVRICAFLLLFVCACVIYTLFNNRYQQKTLFFKKKWLVAADVRQQIMHLAVLQHDEALAQEHVCADMPRRLQRLDGGTREAEPDQQQSDPPPAGTVRRPKKPSFGSHARNHSGDPPDRGAGYG